MRQRLSARYTLWQKIPLTFMLFVIVLLTGISGKILNNLPDSLFVMVLVFALLAAFCFMIIQFLLKERTIVEFDDENLYIINLKDQQQRSIPLAKMIRLNMRPPGFVIGTFSFWTFSLSFTNDSNQDEKIKFVMQEGMLSSPYKRFVSLTTDKNPGFQTKNWTFY